MRNPSRLAVAAFLLVGASAALVSKGAPSERPLQGEAELSALRSARLELQNEAERVMRSLCDELRHASPDGLDGVATAPLPSSFVRLATEAGVCEFRLEQRAGAEVLLRVQGGREQVLASSAAQAFKGEELNYLDDNGNGLIDETWFWASLSGSELRLGLSLVQAHGEEKLVASLERKLTLNRNEQAAAASPR